jgi:hypothetical protein
MTKRPVNVLKRDYWKSYIRTQLLLRSRNAWACSESMVTKNGMRPFKPPKKLAVFLLWSELPNAITHVSKPSRSSSLSWSFQLTIKKSTWGRCTLTLERTPRWRSNRSIMLILKLDKLF